MERNGTQWNAMERTRSVCHTRIPPVLPSWPQHRALASLFDKPCLLGPLADGKDELSGMHGNTALALLLGAQRRFEVTSEHFLVHYIRYTRYILYTRYTYSIGDGRAPLPRSVAAILLADRAEPLLRHRRHHAQRAVGPSTRDGPHGR